MSMKKIVFLENQYYHIYNRGVDKRIIFDEYFDILRFYQSMQEFNSVEPIGSIYENRFNHKIKKLGGATPKFEKLVDIVAYCLNPNHYHLILTPVVENGISEFMRRLNGGYTVYYNLKNKRNGSLFQGTFKSVYIDSDSYLRFLSVYINLNFKVHKKISKEGLTKNKKLCFKSSWDEYLKAEIKKGKIGDGSKVKNQENDICKKDMILSHFDSIKDYKKFAEGTLIKIREKRYGDNDILKDNFTKNKKF